MCGRFTLRTPPPELAEVFGIDARPNLAARYNIAPSQDILIIRTDESGIREFAMPRWGLVPHWAKGEAMGNGMINARAETVAEKPTFRAAFRARRCLVAADGFYEWQKAPDGSRIPHHIRFEDDAPFAIAGLWDRWNTPDGGALETCALITTDANRVVAPIHHRMPVILEPTAYDTWLDTRISSPAVLEGLLRPYADIGLTAVSVGPRVNSARHDDAACLEPASSGMLL